MKLDTFEVYKFLTWPCSSIAGGGWTALPSYQGYDYLGRHLASYGFVVVSISANGTNYWGAFNADAGMRTRGQLIDKHLELWNSYNTDPNAKPQDPSITPGFFNNKINIQNIGLMGHSRGGEGVVTLSTLTARWSIKAVMPLAPTDFSRVTTYGLINRPPLGVILSYCDGDVSDLSGVRYFDDARYGLPGDPAAKHTFLIWGANHNNYNFNWARVAATPGPTHTPIPGGKDDWSADNVNLPNADSDSHCGTPVPGNGRLTVQQQQNVAKAYIGAYFRAYLKNERDYYPLLAGNEAVPPSAGTQNIFASYHAPNTSDLRKDLNRQANPTALVRNDLNGNVLGISLSSFGICGGEPPQPQHCLPPDNSSSYQPRLPHTSDNYYPPPGPPPPATPTARPGLSQLNIAWDTNQASYRNEIPVEQSDVSRYEAIQFRGAVNFRDGRNATDQNLSLKLTDGKGQSASVDVAASYGTRPNPLYYPPGSAIYPWPHAVPHAFLNMVRVPLTKFTDSNSRLDLTNIQSVEFALDRRTTGALLISDIAFTNSLCPAAPPPPTPPVCPNTNYRISPATATATIVPGTLDIGSHCDDCVITTTLPFSFRLYDRTFTTANLSSNGNVQFNSASSIYHIQPDPCITTVLSYTVSPYWGDLTTAGTSGGIARGIYTSISGDAPNRIFNIEWRACQYTYSHPKGDTCSDYVNFEARLYEGRSQIDVIEGTVQDGYNVGVGVQKDITTFTSFECNASGSLTNGLYLTFTQPPCRLDPCPINFQDTPPYTAFNAYTGCLACRGVINGYPCGGVGEPCVCPTSNPYFRPGDPLYRGAISKMVSISAGFSENITSQTFEDVPPDNPFYAWIERLARRGYIVGYPCGANPPGPCVPPGNRPYFRPFDNVTRGQLAKIVSYSAGFTDPPGPQRYEDVPPDSTYFDFIQRLTNRNIMNGYPCGDPNEPCGPGNLPYFRPYSGATRGQASKIVGNAFFQDCNPPPDLPPPVPTQVVDIPPPVPTP